MISKTALHSYCLNFIENTIEDIEALIRDARDTLKADTKSSIGDKYETTREMMQAEIEKLQKQLAENKQMLLSLKVIDPSKKKNRAEIGAMVATQNNRFYLSVGLGKIHFQGDIFMIISIASPFGKALLGKVNGDHIVVNGTKHTITEIQ